MQKSLVLAAAAFALIGCNQGVEGLNVNAPTPSHAASTVVADTVWLTVPKNVGNSSNDYCDHGAYMKFKNNTGNWEVNGANPHAQCVEVSYTTVPDDNNGEPEVTNVPPVAVAAVAADNVECANYGGSSGANGSASTDADGSIVSYDWYENGLLVGTGEVPSITLGLGTHTLTLVVTDDDGATGSDEVVVTVEDTQAPVVGLAVTPGTLWSPNHKYVAISSGATVTDACASNVADLTVSGSVVSNEADNVKGDGNTTGDVKVTRPNGTILLSSNAAPVVAYNALKDALSLRSERAGNKSSRVYSIGFTVTDPSGNAATANGAVVVPHNQ